MNFRHRTSTNFTNEKLISLWKTDFRHKKSSLHVKKSILDTESKAILQMKIWFYLWKTDFTQQNPILHMKNQF